jgi:hypothetical protein
MQSVRIDERVKVRADFTPGGRIVPLMFKRERNDPFRVKKVNASWEERGADGRAVYFSVSVEKSDDVYQLRYREQDRTWWLEAVLVEG